MKLVPQAHGGALQVGNPGNVGGGRPSNAFRERMRQAVEDAKAVEFLIEVVKGEATAVIGVDKRGDTIQGGPRFGDRIEAARTLIEGGHGKPPQEQTVGGRVELVMVYE